MQWAKDFKEITGRFMSKITTTRVQDNDDTLDKDSAVCWASVGKMADVFAGLCQRNRVLIICDEHHHAAIEAAWGKSALHAFDNAARVLVLTGTPVRSDGNNLVWFADGISTRVEGTYTLSYKDAIKEGYCRPVTFQKVDAEFMVDGIRIGTKESSSKSDAEELVSRSGRLTIESLVKEPIWDDKKPGTPKLYGTLHTEMLEYARERLMSLREAEPRAGGLKNAGALVIAPSKAMAEYMANIVRARWPQDKPIMVHSEMDNAQEKIEEFRQGTQKWLISVNMVTEGVDIRRLRVLCYSPQGRTELTLRQALGRVIRSNGDDDLSAAYVVAPNLDVWFAPRSDPSDLYSGGFCYNIEIEMQDVDIVIPPSLRTCKACGEKSPSSAFKLVIVNEEPYKKCPVCGHLHPVDFKPQEPINIEDILAERGGVVTRHMDVSQADADEADTLRDSLVKADDQTAVAMVLKQLTPESLASIVRAMRNERLAH